MRATLLLLLLLLTPAAAQTPVQRAEEQLNRQLGADRLRDAAEQARDGAPRGTNPNVQQLDTDRRSLQPDVGRPEQEGLAAPGSVRPNTGLGSNPQR